jgi:hypothetical protein
MSLVDGLPLAVLRGQVPPRTAGPGPPQHPIDRSAVVGPPATTNRVTRAATAPAAFTPHRKGHVDPAHIRTYRTVRSRSRKHALALSGRLTCTADRLGRRLSRLESVNSRWSAFGMPPASVPRRLVIPPSSSHPAGSGAGPTGEGGAPHWTNGSAPSTPGPARNRSASHPAPYLGPSPADLPERDASAWHPSGGGALIRPLTPHRVSESVRRAFRACPRAAPVLCGSPAVASLHGDLRNMRAGARLIR